MLSDTKYAYLALERAHTICFLFIIMFIPVYYQNNGRQTTTL